MSFDLTEEFLQPIVVVIPAYKEKLDVVHSTLRSLEKAGAFYGSKTSVLLLVNWNVKDDDTIKNDSKSLFDSLKMLDFEFINLKVFNKELSGKKSGVGMARKILMDTAFHNMLRVGIDGLIVNLDADTTVSENYFTEINYLFENNDNMEAASIAFSHIDDSNNETSITAYELHLRYFINMQRLLKLPYAFQTVGSAMVVRRDAYAKEGGMVKRQAGEDFYFLHKYTKNQTLFEINTTTVYPSSRGSDRVPFGTGKAVNDINVIGHMAYRTYNPKSFIVLNNWLKAIHSNAADSLDISNVWIEPKDSFLLQFLESIDGEMNVVQIVKNVTDYDAFKKRFYNWFDAFVLMKYLHYVRDLGYNDVHINYAVDYLFNQIDLSFVDRSSSLISLRQYDLKNDYKY